MKKYFEGCWITRKKCIERPRSSWFHDFTAKLNSATLSHLKDWQPSLMWTSGKPDGVSSHVCPSLSDQWDPKEKGTASLNKYANIFKRRWKPLSCLCKWWVCAPVTKGFLILTIPWRSFLLRNGVFLSPKNLLYNKGRAKHQACGWLELVHLYPPRSINRHCQGNRLPGWNVNYSPLLPGTRALHGQKKKRFLSPPLINQFHLLSTSMQS